MSKIFQEVAKTIKSNHIAIYTLKDCPFCLNAKKLLNENSFSYKEIPVNGGEEKAEIKLAMQKITGEKTFPRIFVGGKCIGGYSELKTQFDKGLHKENK